MIFSHIIRKTIFAAIIISSAISVTTAQENIESAFKTLDNMLTEKYSGISPGAAIVVVKDGNIVYNKGFGLANLEHQIGITDSTVFDIASVSKHFTGYAISMLIEKGQLSLEDEVQTYIPELPDFGSPITINHLLHHTSGLRDWTAALRLSGLRRDDVITYDHILRMAFNQKDLNFPVGSEYSYTNTGYNLLVEIIQRKTGQSFQEWTKENIFKPIGMTNTFFGDDYTQVINNVIQGYEMDKEGHFRRTPNNLVAPGSSSLYTTPNDFAKWMTHMDEAEGMYKSIFNRMYQRGTLNDGTEISYAMGLDMATYRDTEWIDHSGGWASLRSYFTYFPKHHLSIMVMKNNGKDARDIAYDLADLFLTGSLGTRATQEHSMIQKPLTITLPKEDLKKMVGVYQLQENDYLNVFLNDKDLFVRYNNDDKSRIYPVNDSIFWVEQNGSVMRFSNNGKDISYRNNTGKRIAKGNFLSTKELKEYTGRYYSEELSAYYEVKVVGGQLVLYHFNHGNIVLERIWKDSFGGERWFTKTIKFNRDKSGRVIGFKVSHDRARNQYFIKTDHL